MSGQIHPLDIPGVLLIETSGSADARGSFREYATGPMLRTVTGRDAPFRQVNCSRSVRGALRGISVTGVPPGQSKVVTCLAGAILDVTVDLRAGSATFGAWHMERLDEENAAAVYVPPGVGHCFLSLADGSLVMYLLNQVHDPGLERRVNPLDPAIGIEWPDGIEPVLSPRDTTAPGLEEALRAGLLPDWSACAAPDSAVADAQITVR